MATVIGPTPPGTGVICRHFYKVSSLNSMSPVITVMSSPFSSWVSMKVVPTSTAVTPSFSQADLTSPGQPAAAIMISASDTDWARSSLLVPLWQTVT